MKTAAPNAHPVEAMPPPAEIVALGLQHVLVLYAAAVAVPVIVAGALRLPRDQLAFLINADLFTCGLATLIQCVGFARIGIRLPVAMGASFAAVAPLVALATSGVTLNGIFGAVIVAGAFTLALAPFASQLLRYLPPLVTGTIVTMIGLTTLRFGINWAGGGVGAKSFGDPASLALVALVVATILVTNKLFTGLVAQIATLLGLGIGFIVALALGMVDFGGVREANWFALPYPFRFGMPTFDSGAIVSLCVVMLVVVVEATGLLLALGEICRRRLSPPDLARGLAALGVGTIVGGVCNSFPQGAFAQNIGLVSVSGVRSRRVVAAAGGILIALGLLPKLGALVATLPQPVLGGAALVLFGMVAAAGVRILGASDLVSRHNRLIIALSIALGLIPLIAPAFFAQTPKLLAPLFNSGITLTAVSAVLLNAWFNGPAADSATG